MVSIGIDIGSFSIKVAKVRPSNKGYELISFSEYPLNQDPTKDNQIEIIEILRDVNTRIWEEGAVYVVGAHQFDVSLRRLTFPFRERHKILKSLPFELEDDIPFSADNSVFDAKITHFVGNVSHLIACACPKDNIVEILKCFEDGGVQPNIVSVDGIAMSNLLEEWRDSPYEYPDQEPPPLEVSNVDLILNIGHKTTVAAVIKDGYLLDIRLIDWGGRDIADMIASRYSIHLVEALKELRKKAFVLSSNEGATRDQVAMSEVIKSALDNFGQKLNLTLLEMKTLHKLEYRQAILIGGVAQLRNLGPYLTQKIGIATNRLGRLDRLPQLDFTGSPNGEISAVTAIGLAIEGIRRPKNPALNLLRGDFAKQSQFLRNFWGKWSHAIQVTALIFLTFIVWGLVRDIFSTSNSEVSSEALRSQAKKIIGLKGSKISERNINGYIKEQEQKLKLKEMIEGLQNISSPLDVVKRVSIVAPAKSQGNLNIRNFSVTSETVKISGDASRVEILQELQKALKTIAKDGQLGIGAPTEGAKPGYKNFSFNFKIERKSGAH